MGPKTSRDRLLELLGQHVIRKKVECERLAAPARCSQKTSKRLGGHPFDQAAVIKVTERSPEVDYSIFETFQLSEMLRGVGLDPDPLDKAELVKLCCLYKDLSE